MKTLKHFAVVVGLVLLLAGASLAQSSPAAYVSAPPLTNPGLLGPVQQPNCSVNGFQYPTLASCINYLGVTLGLSGGQITDNYPEDWTTNPFRVGFAAEVQFGSGLSATTCNASNINCWIAEVPIVLPPGTTLRGTGRVGFGNNLSSGTPIINGTSFPAPLGIPTEGSITCGASGGSLSNGTYYVQVETVNNLNTAAGSGLGATTVGTSYPTTEVAVTCSNGGSSQSIGGPSPSAVGTSPFQAQDYYVLAASTSGAEVQQQIGTNLFTCGTVGVLDTTTCKMGSTFTIQAIQTGTNGPQLADTTNALIVLGGQVSQGSVIFNSFLRDITIQCQGQGTNSPNVQIYNAEQELSGGSGLTTNGTCGGYTVGTYGPGAGIYNSNLSLNSSWTRLQIGNTATAGTFYPVIMDGRPGPGSAQGFSRVINDATIVARTSGETVPAQLLITGSSPGSMGVIDVGGVHLEGESGNDCIRVDNGAHAYIHGVNCGFAGTAVHATSTAGSIVVENAASGSNHVLQDDIAGITHNNAFESIYVSPCISTTGCGAVQSPVFNITPVAGQTATASKTLDFDSTNSNLHAYIAGADALVSSETSAIASNVIPKAVATHGQTTASSLTDNGTDLVTSEPILAGNTTVLASNQTTTSSTPATLNLALPSIPISTSRLGFCDLLWETSATGDTVALALNTSASLTGLQILGSTYYSATGAQTNLLPPAVVTTATATPITASMTAANATTFYLVHVSFSIITGASNAVVVTVYGSITSAGTLTLGKGSACGWLP